MEMINSLTKCGVQKLVYAEELNRELIIKRAVSAGIQCISALDTRSAVYFATGISAQNQKPVAVLAASGSSRSAYSGMTEAYYRKLPVILITFGEDIDYSVELRDVVLSHCVLSENSSSDAWENALSGQLPMHIEVREKLVTGETFVCTELNSVLRTVLDEKQYLSVGQDISFDFVDFKCKIIRSGIKNCRDGALSNVLGASLAKQHQRYIGLVSKREFLHDMNALGNIHVNDSLLLFVITDESDNLISDYAKALGFETMQIAASKLNKADFHGILENRKKTVVTVYGEK